MGKTAEVPAEFAPGWLAALDGRTLIAQDMQARYAEVCRDLGGREALSYMQLSLVERALWAEHWLRLMERDLAEGKPADLGKWSVATNTLQGIWSKLGLHRRARTVTPNLHDYLKGEGAVA